mgnify:FL=1
MPTKGIGKGLAPLLALIPWPLWLLAALLLLLYWANRRLNLRERWPRWGPSLMQIQMGLSFALVVLLLLLTLGF